MAVERKSVASNQRQSDQSNEVVELTPFQALGLEEESTQSQPRPSQETVQEVSPFDLFEPEGPILSQKQGPAAGQELKPSFIDDVVVKTITDLGIELPKTAYYGLLRGVESIAGFAESSVEERMRTIEEQVGKEEDFTVPIALREKYKDDPEKLKEMSKLTEARTKQRAKERQTEIERLRESAKSLDELRTLFPDTTHDPQNIIEAFVGMTAEFAPTILAGTTTGGIGAVLTSYAQIHNMSYEHMRSRGVAKDKAYDASSIIALVSAPIEAAGTIFQLHQIGRMAGKSAAEVSEIVGKYASKVGISETSANALGRFFGIGVSEGVEEGLQAYPEGLGHVIAENPNATGRELQEKYLSYITSEEFLKRQAKAVAMGSGAAVTTMGFPALTYGRLSGKYAVADTAKRREEGVEARQRLIDAYFRGEETGKGGLKAEHPLAQYNMDLYNKLHQPKGAVFEEMEKDALSKEDREEKILEEARKIEAERKGVEPTKPVKPKAKKAKPAEPTEGREVPDVIVRKDGERFKSKQGAQAVRRRENLLETHEVAGSKEEGFEIRPKQPEIETEEEVKVEATPASDLNASTSIQSDYDLGVYGDWSVESINEVENEAVKEDLESSNKIYSNYDVDTIDGAVETAQDRARTIIDQGTLEEKMALVDEAETLNDEDSADLKDIFRIEEQGHPVSPDLAAFKTNLVRKLLGEHIPDQAELSSAVDNPTKEEVDLDEPPSLFDTDPNTVMEIDKQYEERGWDKIREDPELFTGYLINQINGWVHGVLEPDVGKIKDALSRMRDEADNLYPYFGSQVQLDEFLETVDSAISLAERASDLRSQKSDVLTFRMSLGPDVFYPAVRDTIAGIKKWRGKVNAKSAWSMLSKQVSEEDLKWMGIERIVTEADRAGRKLEKEELLNEITKLPGAQVEVRKQTEGLGQFVSWIEAMKRMWDTGALTEAGLEGSIEMASEAYGVSPEDVRTALDSEDDVETLFHRGEISIPKPTAYSRASHFLNRNPGKYEYEEIVVTLPDAPYDWAEKGVHTDFQSPTAFFARVSRSADDFIVEEIQNEFQTIAAKRGIDIPAPFKKRAWVDLVSSIIAKRASALGYEKVLFPSYDWVNDRWQGYLPKSTKPVYEGAIRKAMNKLGASQIGNKKLSDAALVDQHAEELASDLDLTMERVIQDLESFQRMNKSLPDVEAMLDESLRFMSDSVKDIVLADLNRTRVTTRPEADDRLRDMLTNNKVPENVNISDVLRLTHLVAEKIGRTTRTMMMEDMARRETQSADVDQMSFRTLNMLATIYRDSMVARDTLKIAKSRNLLDATEIMNFDREIRDVVESMGDLNKIRQLESFVYSAMDYIRGRGRNVEAREFYQFRLPDVEPESESYPLTCKCGVDPTDVWRLAKRKLSKRKPISPEKGRRVANMYKEAEKESAKSRKAVLAEFYRKAQAATYDVTGPMKGLLKKTFGEKEARKIINQLILAKGHSVRSSRYLNRAIKDIYGGLTAAERQILNEVIFSSRLIQIGRYKKNVKDFKGRTVQEHREFLTNLEEHRNLSNKKVVELFGRAQRYFDTTLDLLSNLHKEGLIDDEEFESMKKFNWTRTEILNKIDPKLSAEGLTAGATRVGASNRSSGIVDLELGNETDTPQMDMMYVLADWTNRVMKRVHLARMNKELWESTNANPKNGILIPSGVGIKKPKDWKQLEMIVDGKKRTIYAPPEFARWWHLDSVGISPGGANFLRTVSGSAVLRPMATGIRLGFIPVNMIKDLTLMWHASKYMDESGKWQPVYSKFLPTALFQQVRDLGKVAPSAVVRGKKYDDYTDAGGGFSFLAVQGRPFEAAELTAKYGRHVSTRIGNFRRGMGHLTEAASYLNETSEILTRLMSTETALRRIAKREGITLEEARQNEEFYQEAVSIAKDYLDFSQHGSITKIIDQMIPYLNAQVQVGRTYFRAWKRDWRTAAMQHAQMALLGGLFYGMAKYYMGDEEDDITKDIGAWDWGNNLIAFPFGKEMYFENENGEKMYPYLKIPIDGPMAVAKAIGELSVAYMMGEEFRGDVLRESLKAARSLGEVAPTRIPTVAAWNSYAHGIDSFFGGRVWPYDENIPMGERVIPGETPQFFVDMAEMMEKVIPTEEGISPHHLHEAMKDVFTNGNYITYLAGQGYDSWRDVPRADREVALMEALSKFPTTKGIIGMTRPGASRYEPMEESEQEVAGQNYMLKAKVRQFGKMYREQKANRMTGKAEKTRREAVRFIRKADTVDEDQKNSLYDMLKFYVDTPRLKHFSNWEMMQGKTPKTRAREFYNLLQQYKKGSDKWEQVWREAELFPSITTDKFWEEYEKIRMGEVSPEVD